MDQFVRKVTSPFQLPLWELTPLPHPRSGGGKKSHTHKSSPLVGRPHVSLYSWTLYNKPWSRLTNLPQKRRASHEYAGSVTAQLIACWLRSPFTPQRHCWYVARCWKDCRSALCVVLKQWREFHSSGHMERLQRHLRAPSCCALYFDYSHETTFDGLKVIPANKTLIPPHEKQKKRCYTMIIVLVKITWIRLYFSTYYIDIM